MSMKKTVTVIKTQSYRDKKLKNYRFYNKLTLGSGKKRPLEVDCHVKHHMERCIHCDTKLNNAIDSYARYEEDIPPVKVKVTEHIMNGYWCPTCKKIVYAQMTTTLPKRREINKLVK